MMNRYVLKFSKTGYVKYTSHLDMLRVFKRAFKKTGIQLRYSEGFNPHPKLGFAQPLSLGYESDCELLEFETKLPVSCNDVLEKLAPEMPEGIRLVSCSQFNSKAKSLAGETVSCEYAIYIPWDIDESKAQKLLREYLKQDKIFALKRMKRTKTMEPVEIRDKIRSLDIVKAGPYLKINASLDGGSQSNLSPEAVIQSFIEFSGCPLERSDIEVRRTAIGFNDGIVF